MLVKGLVCAVFLFLVAPRCANAQLDESTVSNWADSIAAAADIYIFQLAQQSELQNLWDTELVTVEVVNGAVLAGTLASKIDAVFLPKTEALYAMRNELLERLDSYRRNVDYYDADLSGYESGLPNYVYDDRYFRNVSFSNSTVKFPFLNSFDGDIEGDIDWSDILEEVWKDIVANDTTGTIRYQYFGGASGVTRYYPGTQWHSVDFPYTTSSADTDDPRALFDARVAPWYIQAATGAKDVVVILDSSSDIGNSALHASVKGAVGIISGLSDADFMQVVYTRNGGVRRFDCNVTEGLARATDGNKAEMIEFLEDEVDGSASGKADFEAALQEAYNIFFEAIGDLDAENIGIRSNTSNCLKIIIFVTGTDITADLADFVDSSTFEGTDTPLNNLPVIIHSYSVNEAAKDAPYDLSCEHEGVWQSVTEEDLPTAMVEYYKFIAAGRENDEPFWRASMGFKDDLNIGLVLSGSLPVYSPDSSYPIVIGVVGLDFVFDDILLIMEEQQVGLTYGFMTTAQGDVLVHPRARIPSSVTSKGIYNDTAPIFVDISLVEPFEQFEDDVRAPFVQLINGQQDMIINKPLPKGDVGQEGLAFLQARTTYFWQRVSTVPFIVALSMTDAELNQRRHEATIPIPMSVVDGSELLFDNGETDLLPTGYTLTPSALFGRSSFSHSSWHAAVRAFEDPAFAEVNKRNLQFVREMQIYTNDLSSPKGNVNPGFKLLAKNHVKVASKLDQFYIAAWADASLSNFTSSVQIVYSGTDTGIFRAYPGIPSVLPSTYDPTTRPWYLRAAANRNVNAFSQPYDDAAGTGKVITLSRAVFADSTESDPSSVQVLSVVAVDFGYPTFYTTALASTGCALSKDDTTRPQCFLFDNAGLYILTPDFLGSSFVKTDAFTSSDTVFLGLVEGQLTEELVDIGFLELKSFDNYDEGFTQFTYSVNEDVLADNGGFLTGSLSFDGGYCTEGDYYITTVRNSNTFLLAIDNYGFRNDPDCRIVAVPDAIPLEVDICVENDKNYPRTEPECDAFNVLESVLEDDLRGDDAKCDVSSTIEIVWVHWDDIEAIAVMVVDGVLIVASIIILVILFMHRNTPIIRFSSPLFIWLTFVGVFLSYGLVFMFIGEPQEVVCNLRVWIAAIAFVFIFGNLFTKTYRVWRIFDNKTLKNIKPITNQTLLIYLGVLMIPPILLLVVWMAVDPLTVDDYDDNVDDGKETRRCGGDLALVFGGILMGMAALLMLFGAFIAYRARKARSWFNESRLIALSIYNFMFCLAVAIPLTFIMKGLPEAAFLIIALGILFAVGGTVMILFLPKVYVILFKPEKNVESWSDMSYRGGSSTNRSTNVQTLNDTVDDSSSL